MPSKKIVCLGGGSLYFRWAMVDLVLREELARSELVLYDIDATKVAMMTQLGRRIARQAGTRFKVRGTTSLAGAVDGADFALSSIGGSGADITPTVHGSRFHSADVFIPTKYGIHQLIGDTCGPAGMMMGLRAIPVYLRICHEMEKRCPRAVFFNHSNPMAVLMRAMHKYTSIRAVGVCHGVQGGIQRTAQFLGLDATDLACTWIGTNHYYWLTSILHKGKDIYPELRRRIATQKAPEKSVLSHRLSQIHGYAVLYAQDDHAIEFYPFLSQVPGGQKSLPGNLIHAALEHGFDESKPRTFRPPTAEDRRNFFQEYGKLLDTVKLPPKSKRRAGHGGEEVGGTIAAIATGGRKICIANIANQGAIPNLPYEAEVEVEAVADCRGFRPVHMGMAPPVLKGMLEKRFAWQELVCDAAVTGDRNLALQALMLDEMAIWPDKAKAMLDELLAASRELLPQFFRKNRGIARR